MEKRKTKPIGLAIVGSGRVGRIRGLCAAEYPGVEWIGCCDVKEEVAKKLAADLGTDFYTTDYKELLARPEVTASILATDENERVGALMASIERGHDIFAEKPLATLAVESEKVRKAAADAKVDLVVGYTQRFRRRWLLARSRIAAGQLGEVTSATSRAFLNRDSPISRLTITDQPGLLTPMVVSGTHSLDLVLWCLEGKRPVEVYARSVEKTLKSYGGIDGTFGVFTFDDGTVWSSSMSWALPSVWPASTYSLEIAFVGTKGVLTIDDTHRDMVMATEVGEKTHRPGENKHVSFLGSYPPGDYHGGQFWGPMREETNSWFSRIHAGVKTHHATAEDGHRNLIMCMAMDLSAKRKKPVELPVDLREL
jgi:myo-inositol 2-dehydrogenase/D-chiro-inositol 1-dehydrogenase